MSFTPRTQPLYTLETARERVAKRNDPVTVKELRSLEKHLVQDGLESDISAILRAALHCICWVVARSCSWHAVRWSIHVLSSRSTSSAKRPKAVSDEIQQVCKVLNRRNKVADYISQGNEHKKAKNGDLLKDSSSYLRLASASRYHDVTRLSDSKWLAVKALIDASIPVTKARCV